MSKSKYGIIFLTIFIEKVKVSVKNHNFELIWKPLKKLKNLLRKSYCNRPIAFALSNKGAFTFLAKTFFLRIFCKFLRFLVQHQILRFLYPYQASEEFLYIIIISAFVPSIYLRSKHSGRCNFSAVAIFPVFPSFRHFSFPVVPALRSFRLSSRYCYHLVVPVTSNKIKWKMWS